MTPGKSSKTPIVGNLTTLGCTLNVDGNLDGISFKTIKDGDLYTCVFQGKGINGSFQFKECQIKNAANPLEILHNTIFHSDLPDQSSVDPEKIYKRSEVFV